MPRLLASLTAIAFVVASNSGYGLDRYWHERSTPLNSGEAAHLMPSLAPLVRQVRPAVVNISTTQHMRHPTGMGGNDPFDQFFQQFFGGQPMPQREIERQSLGSGFIIHEKGYVLTNNHVIEGADRIKVKLADGREFPARVIGTDPKTDVALVKIEAKTPFPFVYLGDSDTLQIGDWVVAIGDPFGLELSVTHGLVSAKERSIGAGPYDDFIQSDALINPGNSGGPLFNLNGEVVGINTAITARGQGIGFAVPINTAKQLLPQLEVGKIVRGWLGVGIQPLTPDLAASLGLQNNEGALVNQLIRNGPAARSGIHQGDVIVGFNGHPVATPGQLTRAVGVVSPGSTIDVRIVRDGQFKDLKVRIGQRPEDNQLEAGGETPGEGGEQGGEMSNRADALGLSVRPLDPDQAASLGLNGNDGVSVAGVKPDGPAAQAGVQGGDIILEVNRKAIHSVGDYHKALKSTKAGEMVLLRLQRQQASIYVAVKI